MLGIVSHEHDSTPSVIVGIGEEMRNKNQSKMVTTMQEKWVASVVHGRSRIMLSHGTSGRWRCECLESVHVVTMGHFSKKMEEQHKEDALIPYYKKRMEGEKHILISLC